MRTAIFVIFGALALAADVLAASSLFADGPSIDLSLDLTERALFLHLVAAAVGAAAFTILAPAPTGRDRTAHALLFLSLSLPLPGVGLGIAALVTTALTFTKNPPVANPLLRVGNPLKDPITGSLDGSPNPNSCATAEPLASRIRSADLQELRTLAIGLRGMSDLTVSPVLERLQYDGDTYLQLYAQGDAAEATAEAENQLRIFAKNAAQNPGDHLGRIAFAAHLLHLAEDPNIAADQYENHLVLALDQIRAIATPRAHALRAAIHIRRRDPKQAAESIDHLIKSDPESLSVPNVETAILRANLLHLERNWPELATHLRTPELADDPGFARVLNFFSAA